MNKLVHLAAAGSMLAAGAMAQDLTAQAAADSAKLKAKIEAETVQFRTVGAVRGNTVKGAPYSAEEVNESNQVLADGTRIHRENRTQVYRDSEGRTRRETPDNITITDPVSNVTYTLNPKTMKGQKLAMASGNFVFLRTGGPALPEPVTSTFSVHSSGDGPATISVNGVPMDEKQMQEMMNNAKASGSPQTFTYERKLVTPEGGSSVFVTTTDVSGRGGGSVSVSSADGAGGGGGVVHAEAFGGRIPPPARPVAARRGAAGQSLGKQVVEGVSAEGTRETTTLPAGSIGNDRPIEMVTESWYSPELQTMISTRHSDPRTGDEIFRVTNIQRGEPGAYLFQPPAGYQINEPKRRD